MTTCVGDVIMRGTWHALRTKIKQTGEILTLLFGIDNKTLYGTSERWHWNLKSKKKSKQWRWKCFLNWHFSACTSNLIVFWFWQAFCLLIVFLMIFSYCFSLVFSATIFCLSRHGEDKGRGWGSDFHILYIMRQEHQCGWPLLTPCTHWLFHWWKSS